MTTTPIAIVTGANSGIGRETARGLARAGFHVVLLCRNESKAADAKADIDATVAGASTEIELCDLSSMAAVRATTAALTDRLDRLDVLVNNAGVTIRRRTETAEGLDTMLAVNHLGPFLLTDGLLPLLAASAPARIVTVASEAHKLGRLDLDDLQAARRGYGLAGFPRYGEVKLMNILWTRALARRVEGTGITANCLHPGAVRTNLGAPPRPVAALIGLVFLSAEQGARTSLAVATSPDFTDVNGAYAVKSRPADHKLNATARDDDLGERLWAATEALLAER